MEIQFSVHARAPQMGDTLVWMGDGWEPQSPYARAQRETHVHTTTIPQINMGLTRSPNFVSGSAGWQIEADGSAEFNDVVVRGTIYASAGEIAGWTIASGHLYAGTGAGRVGLRPVDYPFYAGAENPAAAPFRVTAAGALVATSATITGTITATSGTIGGWDITATQIQATGDVVLLDSAGIITVGGAGYLTSNPFTSGTQGWRITPTEAEFGNITARGEIRTAVFKYGEIHAQAGQLLVTPNAAKLDEDLTIAASGSFNVGEAGRFGVNDIVRLKDGTGDVWLKVTADNGDGTYNYSRQSGSVAGTVFRAGTAVVGYGASGEGGIVLDAVTANGPFIDIFTHAGAPWTTLTTKVRVGNLAGIVDADLNPTGYGFYSDNAYLKGDLVAGGGKVIIDNTGVHIDIEGALPSSGRVIFEDFDATYDFWAMLWTYASGSAYKFSLRNRAATATYTTATTSLTAEGPAATVETVSEVYLSTSGWSGLRSAAGTYAVVGVWDGPATVVRPKTTWNSGGNIVHKLFDAAGATKLSVQDSAEVEVAYVDSNGKMLCALDTHPDSDGRGAFARFVNRLGISTYDLHFRSGAAPPAGYAWQGAPFGGTPATSLDYAYASEYLTFAPTASTRYFLSRAVTNAGANWQGKRLDGRFNARVNGRVGLRFDDGTDNNYSQVYATGEANNGTMTVTYQYRTGGGGVTTVTSSINVPAGEFISLVLYMAYSAPNYTAVAYILAEDGSTVSMNMSNAVAWAPVAGRAGVFGENPSVAASNRVEVDWLRNQFV